MVKRPLRHQERMREDPDVVATTNRIAYEVAEKHDVLVTDLVRFKNRHSETLTAARTDLLRRLQATIQYRDLFKDRRRNREWHIGPLTPEMVREGWQPISTTDIGILAGSADHTAIVKLLRDWRREQRARLLEQKHEVAAWGHFR